MVPGGPRTSTLSFSLNCTQLGTLPTISASPFRPGVTFNCNNTASGSSARLCTRQSTQSASCVVFQLLRDGPGLTMRFLHKSLFMRQLMIQETAGLINSLWSLACSPNPKTALDIIPHAALSSSNHGRLLNVCLTQAMCTAGQVLSMVQI